MAFDYIPLWDKYEEILEPLSDEELGRLIRAMLAYKAGEDPVTSGNERFVWPIVRRDIDQVKEKYEAKVANGSLGGRPRKTEENQEKLNETKNNLTKPNENQKKPKKTNINDNVNVKDNIISPNGENKARAKRFTPPTLAEVQSYVAERHSQVDPQGFIDFYESKGWMVGKTPMKDWKAACRNAEGWDRWTRPSAKAPSPKADDRRAAAAALGSEGGWIEKFLAEQQGGTKSE